MAVTVVSGGVQVEVDHRMYSWNSNVEIVAQGAYLTDCGSSGDLLDPLHVWRTQRSVRTVVGFLALNVAQVPLHVFTTSADGDRQRVRSGLLAETLAAPHPAVTPFAMMRDLKIDRCLWERYAALKIGSRDNGRVTLVRLPPNRWRFERDVTGLPTAVLWRPAGLSGTVSRYELDDLVWFDGYQTGSDSTPMQALFDLLSEQDESSKYRTELWANGARMPGWISRPESAPEWTTTAKSNFRSGWSKFASGGSRAGASPILEDGMQYHQLTNGVTPVDAQQLDARKLSIAEVASAFHLPPVFAGLLDSTSHSNVTAYRQQLYGDVLGPDFMDISQGFNARLVPDLSDSPDDFVEFNVAEKLRMSFEEQAKIFQTATGAPTMTRNEARRRQNLPHIDGADDLIVPLNVLVGGQASPTDSVPDGGS